MSYAIIHVGGKQYRVREGERLLVDRLKTDEGKTFNPRVLLVGGNGKTDLTPSTTVTARVVGHVLGDKIRIGKYKRRTGYKRHNGFRAATTRIEISLGGETKKAAPKKAAEAPKAEAPKAEAPAAATGLPDGYEKMTVAQVGEGAKTWDHATLEAALAYEQANAARKGALAALESALKKEDAS